MDSTEKTRQVIVEAASSLFVDQGYSSVGVRQIAEKACVPPAILYRYFGSKLELFEEVIRSFEGLEALWRCPSERLPEKLTRLVLQDDDELGSVRKCLSLFVNSVGCEEASPVLRRILLNRVLPAMSPHFVDKLSLEKAYLLTSIIFGVFIVRGVIRTPEEGSKLEELLRDSFRAVIGS